MELLISIGTIGLILLFWFFLGPIRRRRRRAEIMNTPFPAEWDHLLAERFPLYSRMPATLRQDLQDRIKVFLEEKRFIGCEGLEISDEIRLIIAAQACLLIINRKTRYYPKLKSIYVYPTAYFSNQQVYRNGIIFEDSIPRLGESWNSGELVLAWDSAEFGALNMLDGGNVVYHEFAHQLDQEDGIPDGAPILKNRAAYISWARVLQKEYDILKNRKKKHRKTLLNKYGTTNPAEFFAVASEAFFEKPLQLQRKKPELYEELKSYYRTDPAQWFRNEKR